MSPPASRCVACGCPFGCQTWLDVLLCVPCRKLTLLRWLGRRAGGLLGRVYLLLVAR